MSAEALREAIADHGQTIIQMKQDVMSEVNQVKNNLTNLEQEFARLPSGGSFSPSAGISPVRTFMDSDAMDSMKRGANSTGRVELSDSNLRSLQAAITTSSYDVQPQRAPGVYDNPQPRLSLLDLLPVLPVTTGQFEYMVMTAAANGAAFQIAEGDEKAESNPAFEVRQTNIATIAHWTNASLQILQDAPALERQLTDLLRYGVNAKLEAEILNGVGGTGQILGLLPQATAFTHDTGATVNLADRIGEAITSLGAAGWSPNAIVMNHQDWFKIASMKTSDSDYTLGSPRNPASTNLWGVNVVLSAGMPVGQCLVMDTAQTAVLDRQQATVMMSREAGSNFTRNLATLLAELRAGLAVFAPSAVLNVDLTETAA